MPRPVIFIDKAGHDGIIKTEGALLYDGQPQNQLGVKSASRPVAAGRLARFWGHGDHQGKDPDDAHDVPENLPSHKHHLPSQGSG